MMLSAVRPEYMELESRLESFSDWPAHAFLSGDRLAQAGFFYTGDADCTRCFSCGGAVRSWRPADNEWIEHARYFPKCHFLLQHLSEEFLDAVIRLRQSCDQITVEMVHNFMVQRSSYRHSTTHKSRFPGGKSNL